MRLARFRKGIDGRGSASRYLASSVTYPSTLPTGLLVGAHASLYSAFGKEWIVEVALRATASSMRAASHPPNKREARLPREAACKRKPGERID
jgi:hypothetical protein